MAPRKSRRCPVCGASVSGGVARCPNGHDLAGEVTPADATTMDLETRGPETTPFESSTARRVADDSFDPSTFDLGSSAPDAVSNTIYECFRCERLVETLFHRGRYLAPRFCPWCGKRLSSLIARELDGYRLDKVLAAGGFGIVYLASNIAEPAMKAVVKVLRPRITYTHPEIIKIFVEEARLTEAVGQTCWNIVRVSNVREKPWAYFFMEYIRGTTLDRYIDDLYPETVPLDDGLGYLRGIARALAATHKRGRIHRDLKPVNLMVILSKGVDNAEERIKLLDFGLAMKVAGAGEDPLASGAREGTEVGESPLQTAGTPEYMPPESFDGFNTVEGDIYSFGVTAYEVLTGRKPWRSPPADADRLKYWENCHKKIPPKPIREVRPEVPKWLARVIMACLEKRRSQRIATAGELLRRLRAPVRFWVWASSAALVVLLVAFATWQSAFSSTRTRVHEWVVEGSPPSVPGDTLALHVKGAEDLSRREVIAVLRNEARGLAWSATAGGAPADGVLFEGDPAEPRRVRIRFDEPSRVIRLLGRTLRITGRRSGFLESFVAEGDLALVLDPDPPRVSEERAYLAEDGLRQLPAAAPRLRRGLELLVRIDDRHLDPGGIRLGVDAAGTPIAGVKKTVGGKDLWAFPLASLGEGTYRGIVEARDRAGNLGQSSPFEFTIDESVQVELAAPLLAAGKAYFRCRPGEPLSRMVPYESGAGEPLSREFFAASGLVDALEIARRREQLESVALSSLIPGEVYFVAVPLPPSTISARLRIEISDTALAVPVTRIEEFALELPVALGKEDIDRVTVQLAGETMQSIEPAYLATGSDPDPEARRIAVPGTEGERNLVGTLILRLTPGSVQRASIPRPGLQAAVGIDVVRFEGLGLVADEVNRLSVHLVDPLERILEVRMTLLPDSTAPELEIVQMSNGRTVPVGGYHDVRTGNDVALEVWSSEALSSVHVLIGSVKKKLQALDSKGQERSGRHGFGLPSLESFALREGTYELTIEAIDLVGHEAAYQAQVILNHAAPTVEEAGDVLRLGKTDDHVFHVRDENGVDITNTTFSIRLDGDESAIRLESRAEGASGEAAGLPTTVAFRVDLTALKDRCRGELIPRLPDGNGRVNDRPLRFEFDRLDRWRETVRWNGLEWILCSRADGTEFYIARTEVSNRVFNDPAFIRDGAYVDGALRERYAGHPLPRFWVADGGFPEYVVGGKAVSGDDFPVVGVSPEEAEEFALQVFGARLPTWKEWLTAAWMGNPNGRFPWKDARRGKAWFNHLEVGDGETPDLVGKRAEAMVWKGRGRRNWKYLRVDEDFFPPAVRRENRSCAILHQMGNVGELVRLDDDSGSRYGIAGGDFDTSYRDFSLNRRPRPYDRHERSYRTGFRLLIDIQDSRTHGSFKKAARKE